MVSPRPRRGPRNEVSAYHIYTATYQTSHQCGLALVSGFGKFALFNDYWGDDRRSCTSAPRYDSNRNFEVTIRGHTATLNGAGDHAEGNDRRVPWGYAFVTPSRRPDRCLSDRGP
jgi:hypothetical protein